MSRPRTMSRTWAAWVISAAVLIGSCLLSPLALAQVGAAEELAVAIPGQQAGLAEPAAPTAGQPAAMTQTAPIPTKDLWSVIRDGGPLMIPIAFSSLLLLAFVFERMISLRRGRVIPRPFVTRFLQQLHEGSLDRDKALQLCEDSGSPVSEVFAGAVRKWGRPAVEVEQAIIDNGERVTNGLRKYLRVINGVATVTPLLGLLGTVVGMIRAFNNIATADALGRPELLAKGIGEALLTTAAGLTVAIPALICYLWFVSRVDRLIIDIDAMGQEVVNVISAEELENKKTRATKSRRNKAHEAAA